MRIQQTTTSRPSSTSTLAVFRSPETLTETRTRSASSGHVCDQLTTRCPAPLAPHMQMHSVLRLNRTAESSSLSALKPNGEISFCPFYSGFFRV
jgi:hypothetical protein